MEWKARFACFWIQLRNVIRSLREDVLVSQNSEHHVRMVAQLRRERMVAHDFANTSFLVPEITSCRYFNEGNVPIMVALRGPSVSPFDEIQMKTSFMMATLISRSQAKSFSWYGESTVHAHFSTSIWAWWLKESTDVSPVVRNWSGSPQWCRASGVGKAQSAKVSSIVLMSSRLLQRHASPLKSLGTTSTCWEIMMARMVRMSFLAMPFFLTFFVADI